MINYPPTQLGPSIQSQFNSIVGSPVSEQVFEFKIDQKTYVDRDGDPLTYKMEASDFQMLQWINFEADNLVLRGKPPENSIGKKVFLTFKISDGIYQVQATLQTKVKMSFWYIFKLLSTILVPVTSAIGLFQKRQLIHGLLCKKKYRQNYVIPVNQLEKFQQIFILIKEDMDKGYLIWRMLKHRQVEELKLNQSNYSNWFIQSYIILQNNRYLISYKKLCYDLGKVCSQYNLTHTHADTDQDQNLPTSFSLGHIFEETYNAKTVLDIVLDYLISQELIANQPVIKKIFSIIKTQEARRPFLERYSKFMKLEYQALNLAQPNQMQCKLPKYTINEKQIKQHVQ